MPISDLSLAVVGADFPNKRGPTRRFAIALCRPGDHVRLAPEPKNPADPRAVQVLTASGDLMGYISAERCGWIGRMITEGRPVRAIFQAQTSFGALVRVALDGNEPDLPPIPQDNPNQLQDWWPDEVPQDD